MARVLRVDTRARYTRVRRGAMYQALIHAPATLASNTGKNRLDGAVRGYSHTHPEGGATVKTKQETQTPAHRLDAMVTLRLTKAEKLELVRLSRMAGKVGNYSEAARWAIASAPQTAKTPAAGR